MTEKIWHIHEPVFRAEKVCPDYRVWPWNGHRLFAYDLMAFLQPKMFVELGTYWGTSFFSFCQAVQDFHLGSRCVAIDTWEGDDHTGKYEQKVYDTVRDIAGSLFSDTDIHLLQKHFKDAVVTFADGSIDLLHIDGFHTYEAVREDFTTWFPKLADNGVVLFHDIADSCEYGSVRYWHELLAQYPGFSFQHSWGLGVLFPKGNYFLEEMERNNIADKMKIYECRSEYNLLKIQKDDGEKWREQQDALIKNQENSLAALLAQVAELEGQLERMRSS
ncbi:MAG: hypothetical protein HGB26_05630, partial [Desulfobulbaceae bacterium]|nr:hypothetical protein [Desulfobulbaceae bacterium]